jgi:hypothetical protein
VSGAEDHDFSTRNPADRADVISALQRHGLSRAVAAELWRIARTLRTNTRRRDIEYAATLDADSGHPVGSVLTGTTSSTDLTPHLRAFQAGHAYVQLHANSRHDRSRDRRDLVYPESPTRNADSRSGRTLQRCAKGAGEVRTRGCPRCRVVAPRHGTNRNSAWPAV